MDSQFPLFSLIILTSPIPYRPFPTNFHNFQVFYIFDFLYSISGQQCYEHLCHLRTKTKRTSNPHMSTSGKLTC